MRDSDAPAVSPDEQAAALLALTRGFLADLHPGGASRRAITLDSALERDLGLDSLSRVELAVRLGRAFGVALPEPALAAAQTLRDLLDALRLTPPSGAAAPSLPPLPAPPDGGCDTEEALPDEATTLLEVLDWHVRCHPERVQIICLDERGETRIRYHDLARQADCVAAGLQRAGLEAGQACALMLPTCPDYFFAYLGILRAGGVPVPIYPPARLNQIEEHVRRHAGILANAEARLLLTVPEARTVARLLEAQVAGLRRVVTVAELASPATMPADVAARPAIRGGDTAFIQYTSGSTGDPKGVVLSHANLLANIRAMGRAIGLGPGDVAVSWLPLYHDMGLICAWLSSLYHGVPLVVMSPLAFLARPERWLQAIHRYRGTVSAAPNFAYELCVKRIDDADLQGLDLSCWRVAANGAEPVLPDTLRRFGERFARYGLRPGALMPVYGLAECAVGLLSPPVGRGPRIDRVSRDALGRNGLARPAGDEAGALAFVCCGRPLPGHEIRIVDSLGREVGERIEGRLEFRGPSATAGYHHNPEQTRRLFDGDWLDSGDRAYVADGEVYLTGRVKDIIIRGGRNIYPHEIENLVGEVPGVRRGCVAAFGSPDPASGTERLVVLAETRETDATARDALRTRIVDATLTALGEPPDEVVLAPPQAVLKTSSGKIRRAACREAYERGSLGRSAGMAGMAGWQMLRLAARAVLPQARRLAAAGVRLLWGSWVWLLFALLAPPTWLLTALTGRPALAWRLNRLAARGLLRLAGLPLTVRGLDQLPAGRCVLVANHASYADGLLLVAALPQPFSFVAKRELRGAWLSRRYLTRLGARFVERFDARQSVEDARGLAEAVAAGVPLAFFPEGTFTRRAALAPFHLGAFSAAAAAGVPVLPVAIRGTRTLLRDGQWLPRRTPLALSIGAPLHAPATAVDTFAGAVALRDGARAFILAHCGEPDGAAD